MEQIKAADGQVLDCHMEPAVGTARGGIVILQEIFGITDQLVGVAKAYAERGFDVAVPALFDRQAPGTVVPYDQAKIGRDLMMSADLDQTLTDIDAAVNVLRSKGHKVGVIGFCWGGGLALRVAQKLNVDAAVAFYGTRLPQYLDSPLQAPFLGHFGTKDDHVPPEMLAEAQAYLPEMQVQMYEAGHAFANEARPSYRAKAAELAHERTAAFLAEHLG